MNEQILKIEADLETTGEYDLTMSRLLHEIVLQNKTPEELINELKAHQKDYRHYLDLLDTLKIDDDTLEVLEMLFDKINVYGTINLLIEMLRRHNRVISTIKQIPQLKQVLNKVQQNPGVSKTALATIMNIDSNILTQVLNEAERLSLISITCDWYSSIKQSKDTYYFLTAQGGTYVKLLNKEEDE